MTKIFKWPFSNITAFWTTFRASWHSKAEPWMFSNELIDIKPDSFFSVQHLTSYDWMNFRFCKGTWFFLAHTFPSVSASYWHMIWCWHRPPWEKKGDKERRSLTSYWTLSSTVGISIQGKIQKMVKLHVDSQRDYRELKNRRARAVETFSSA